MKANGLWPRGLSREKAAFYVGVSATTFDKLVTKKKMPSSKEVSPGRVIWDIQELDLAIESLPEKSDTYQQKQPWEA
jgi:predicted DNA-binding transcriptional regulator AlpA|tara:strand:- start:340 stop:570 length:231 start_codon:yes stop_codon:yes gene_type:complete